MLHYCWTCDFRRLKVSQGKVRTINRWGGIPNHLSMAYLYQKLLESDNYGWNCHWWLGGILFLRHSVFATLQNTSSLPSDASMSCKSSLLMKPSWSWSIMLNASLNSWICAWSNMANTFEVARCARFLVFPAVLAFDAMLLSWHTMFLQIYGTHKQSSFFTASTEHQKDKIWKTDYINLN